jgi:hypothetical protein
VLLVETVTAQTWVVKRARMYASMVRAYRQRVAAIALGILLACCFRISAVDPSLDVDQYAHRGWKACDDLTKGTIDHSCSEA